MPRRDRRLDLTGRVVVVTGGNSGIGKETVAGLANLGATVVLASRDPGRGEAAKADLLARSRPTGAGDIVVGELDLGSFASIRSFAAWVLDRFDRLDVLVCNAGLITEQRRTTAEGFEEMFGVNHLGHFLLADLVRERLVASAPSRVVVVSSFAHRWVVGGLPREDLQREQGFGSFAAYGGSKLANLQFARELARRLGPSGVVVNALHPGSIKSHFGGDGDTGMLGWLMGTLGPFVLRGPAAGARMSILLASSDAPRVAASQGGYWSHGRSWRGSRASRDPEAQRWLWAESERLVAEASGTTSPSPSPDSP